MATSTPRISILTVNRNNRAGLARTIDSVAAQTSPDFEHIVVDGASQDGSVELVEASRPRLAWAVSEPDSGIYEAMNKGIRRARGGRLLFLNSGDCLADERVVEDVLPLLDGDEIVSGDLDFFERDRWLHLQSEETLTPVFFVDRSLYHQATFIPRTLFDRYGLYDETFRIAGDFEFFVRSILRNGAGYRRIPRTVARCIGDGVSNRPENRRAVFAEKDRAWRAHFAGAVVDDLYRQDARRRSPVARLRRRIVTYVPLAARILK